MPRPAPNPIDFQILAIVTAAAEGIDTPMAREFQGHDIATLAKLPACIEWVEMLRSLLVTVARGLVNARADSELLRHLPIARGRLDDIVRLTDATGEWRYEITWPDAALTIEAIVAVARRFGHHDFARDLDRALHRIRPIEALTLPVYALALEQLAAQE